MRKILLPFLIFALAVFPAIAQNIGSGGGGNGGGGIPATGNIALSVNAATGNDATCAPSGVACATVQRAVNIAAQYNYQGLYTPTINVADGTYNEQTILPALVNCPAGGSIIGNTTTWTNVVVNDTGTAAVFTPAYDAFWSISGMRVGGTVGAVSLFLVHAVISLNDIDFHGGGTAISTLISSGTINLASGTFTISSPAMNYFINDQGTLISVNSATLTFSNAITFANNFIWLDSPYGFIAGYGFAMVNGANVTTIGAALRMTSGSYFEAYSTTTVDGAQLSRSNFPGNAAGFAIDATAKFQADYLPYYGNVNVDNPVVALFDPTGVLRADYGYTRSGAWTAQVGAGNYFNVQGSAPGLAITDTETHGSGIDLFMGVNGTTPYFGGEFFFGSAPTGFASNYDNALGFQIPANAVSGWSSNATYADGAAMDTGVSRAAAATLAVGNGTPGDFSGTVKAAHATLTTLANTATTSAVCYNTSTGVLTYDGTIGTCNTSDERLKNIGPRIDDALGKLLSINGFYFTYKDQDRYGKGQQIGVGAQTVEKVFPELVETGLDGIKSVAYEKLAAPIIEAMRELKGENDKMRTCLSNWQCRLFGLH